MQKKEINKTRYSLVTKNVNDLTLLSGPVRVEPKEEEGEPFVLKGR